jgi:hypothetical protein
MPSDLRQLFDEYLAKENNRGFGDIALRANAAVSPFSSASMEAAGNLLAKARKALREGDRDRATRYVDRAVALPYDEVEEAAPAALEAHMALFMAITDELEDADADDQTWLDAALVVLDAAPEAARFDLRNCLVSIDQDYRLSRREHRRIQKALAPVPSTPELYELDLRPDELKPAIMQILETVIAYQAALD